MYSLGAQAFNGEKLTRTPDLKVRGKSRIGFHCKLSNIHGTALQNKQKKSWSVSLIDSEWNSISIKQLSHKV